MPVSLRLALAANSTSLTSSASGVSAAFLLSVTGKIVGYIRFMLLHAECDYPQSTIGNREVAQLNGATPPAPAPSKVKHGDAVGFKCTSGYMFASGNPVETATCTDGVLDVTASNLICHESQCEPSNRLH